MVRRVPHQLDEIGIGAGGIDLMNRTARREAIRALNDGLRTTLQGGRVMMTVGIRAQGEEFVGKALTALRDFKDFDEDNDPHGEHDFGSLVVDGRKCFFKLDYYNADMTAGSECPEHAKQTTRVLTLMLAEKY